MNVILLGASTRAAAMSARRAGWTPWCADLYADADLERIASVRKVPLARYPHGLLTALRHAPDAPVIYTGGLENWPRLIAKIERPILGNPPEVLRAVRSPERWTQCLRPTSVPYPKIAAGPVASGDWLLKPRKSAGGLGIHTYLGPSFNPRTHFLQERIDGIPCSAVFLGQADGATLLGATRQLIGTPWLHAPAFHYAGNVGPLPLAPLTQSAWQRIGMALVRSFSLRGLFGVDAIERDGVPWPIEINPRYTASVELLERSSACALLTDHFGVFVDALNRVTENGEPKTENDETPDSFSVLGSPLPGFPVPNREPITEKAYRCHGKAILYARQTFAFPEQGPWLAALEPGAVPDAVEYADIPHAAEVIEQGRPVLTVFASAATADDCEVLLREKTQALARCLWGP